MLTFSSSRTSLRLTAVMLVFITVMVVIKESAMAYFVEVDGEVCVKNGTEPCGETVHLQPSGIFENGPVSISGRYSHEGEISSVPGQPDRFAAHGFGSADLTKAQLTVLLNGQGPIRAHVRARLREVVYFVGSPRMDGIADDLYLIGAGLTAAGMGDGTSTVALTVIPLDPGTGSSGPIYSQTRSLGDGSGHIFFITGTAGAIIIEATLDVSMPQQNLGETLPIIANFFLVLPDGVTFRSESGALLTQRDAPAPCHGCTATARRGILR